MTGTHSKRGAVSVGFVAELDEVEAASVIYLRLWCDGPDAQSQVWRDFSNALGPEQGRQALETFETLCGLCVRHGRRPMMRHSVHCKCLGSDESCFANFIATAATGDWEDAMLIATLLVRADIAPVIASLAMEIGLTFKRMQLSSPVPKHEKPNHSTPKAHSVLLH